MFIHTLICHTDSNAIKTRFGDWEKWTKNKARWVEERYTEKLPAAKSFSNLKKFWNFLAVKETREIIWISRVSEADHGKPTNSLRNLPA